MAPRKLKIAIAGLGRMGARHARHLYNLTPRAELVAASSPDRKELEWANNELHGVRTYEDYDEMLRREMENGLEAVLIASVTTVHAEQAIKALKLGLHVLCEKPLSTSAEVSQAVCDAYRESIKRFPSQKAMCGFSRRFDASYRDAYEQVQRGVIGRPVVFRSQTCDKLDPSGFFVSYAQFSGGIFVDCCIHDIDLLLWFFGEDVTRVKSVSAVGITAVSPELRRYQDRDNAFGLIELYDEDSTDGRSDRIAHLFCSRIMAAGQEDATEITGTRGKLAVNTIPATNLVNVYDPQGIHRTIPPDYYGRFRDAFVTEANEFTACCLDDTAVPMRLEGAVKAVKIACGLQESLITGVKIDFDRAGNRITPLSSPAPEPAPSPSSAALDADRPLVAML